MSTNGKGDHPRNLGPMFRENYDRIRWKRDADRQRQECGDTEEVANQNADIAVRRTPMDATDYAIATRCRCGKPKPMLRLAEDRDA